MKVALVHDYLDQFGGAERVLPALSEMFPEAPVFVIYSKKNSPAYERFKNKKIIESWFGRLPFCDKLISPLRFLLPLIWGSMDFDKYDLVITSSAWGMGRGFGKHEICYLHTPPRYLYGFDTSRKLGVLAKIYSFWVNPFLRWYDKKQMKKVGTLVVNSENVGKRVERIYHRKDYKVVYPPVDFRQYRKNSNSFLDTDFYLAGGRNTKAKNFDLIEKACKKAGVELKLFGDPPVGEEELSELYAHAKAFIVAQKDEDFGITPLEANAAGCPVIAYRGGGYLETVVDGKTGIFFDKLTALSLTKAIKKIDKMKFDKKVLVNHARKFGKERFVREMKEVIENA